MTQAEQDEMAEWIQDHRVLYDKADLEFKNKTMRQKLWENKAAEVGITLKSLKRWYDTMRTKYGKLTTEKSGGGSKEFEGKNRWILEKFDFCKTHIIRQVHRTAQSVSSNLQIILGHLWVEFLPCLSNLL